MILIDDEEPVDEEEVNDNWIPNSAYSMAHSFRKTHGDELSFDLINDMLRDLNKIYREREKKQITRIKAQSRDELNLLKRKLSYRAPFDEVTHRKNMARMREKINALESELSKNEKKKNAQAQNVRDTPLDMVENTLQLVTQMQVKRKQMEAENTNLKESLTKLREVQDNEVHDKQKFMEGAVWMGRRMSGEIERICQVIESLTQEYKVRFGDLEKVYTDQAVNQTKGAMKQEMELISMQRAQIWFLDAIQTTTLDLYERTVTMLEGALYHREDAESRLGDAYTPVRRDGDPRTTAEQTTPGGTVDVEDEQFYSAVQNPDLQENMNSRQPSLNVFNMGSCKATSPSNYNPNPTQPFSQKNSKLTSKQMSQQKNFVGDTNNSFANAAILKSQSNNKNQPLLSNATSGDIEDIYNNYMQRTGSFN